MSRYKSYRHIRFQNPYIGWNNNLMSKLARNKHFPKWAKKILPIQTIINVGICAKHGHEWIDTSYGGPESGQMSGECQRCGHSFCTILY